VDGAPEEGLGVFGGPPTVIPCAAVIPCAERHLRIIIGDKTSVTVVSLHPEINTTPSVF
jgi:hypothetical protein